MPLFTTLWIRRTFGKEVDITQILFHLRFPVETGGADLGFILSFLSLVLLPSLAITLILGFPSLASRLCLSGLAILLTVLIYLATRLPYLWNLVRRHSLLARYALIALLCIYGTNYTVKKLKISNFLENNKAEKSYSNFYEQHYIPPQIQEIQREFATVEKPRNLLIIYMESMEATFSSKDARDYSAKVILPPEGLTPRLSALAQRGLHFDSIKQTVGAGWTIAGLISYNCAFPQTWLPFNAGFNDNVARHFLHSATCLGDVLHALGYKQAFFRGANADFAGSRGFFRTHHIAMNDLSSIEEWASMYPAWRNDWGVKDSVLFGYVRAYLEGRLESQAAQTAIEGGGADSKDSSDKLQGPFALFVLTADSHFPGFVDKLQCDLPTSYANSLVCHDTVVGDFVEWFLQSPYAENTTVILLGDHYTMQQGFLSPSANRSIYNAFINPAFTTPPSPQLLSNRKLSHFDITSLILDSLAIRTRAFGLGRNPLYGSTLMEDLGESTLADELSKHSRLYEGFWDFNPSKQ